VNCGHELPTSVNYCPNCGQPIRKEKGAKYTSEDQVGISQKGVGENSGDSHKKVEKKKEEMSTGFVIAILIIIIFFASVFAYWIWQRYITNEMFDKGCSATGYDMWGFVDEWDCPTT
jgi:uncharacterized membrane protein YvbJ